MRNKDIRSQLCVHLLTMIPVRRYPPPPDMFTVGCVLSGSTWYDRSHVSERLTLTADPSSFIVM